jgi:pimeloyl-ACP methyl ester carboxylesterase
VSSGGRFRGLKAAGLAGALVSAAAVGAAAGMVAERYALGRSRRPIDDPYAEEPFGLLPADVECTVMTNDDVPLHVEIVEPDSSDAPPDLTVVFVHGFCLDMGTFHFQRRVLTEQIGQRRALAEQNREAPRDQDGKRRRREDKSDVGALPALHSALEEPRCRLVFYDQPGHGRSGRREDADYHLDQLGEDLARVLEEVCPDGPLVLVGHSMGAMTIMALAEHDPDLFNDRVVGVGLISTSAGHLDQVGLGIPPALARFRKPLMPTISGALRWQPELAEVGRRAGSDLAYLLTRRYGFGSKEPSPALVEYVEHMNSNTSVAVIAAYLGTLSEHDRYAALEVFDGIEALIVCGDRDLLTPVEHTREMARMLPGAELVEVADGGHVTLMEHADLVNAHFIAFIRRAARSAASGRPTARTRKERARDEAARVERREKAGKAGPQERRVLRRILRRRGA